MVLIFEVPTCVIFNIIENVFFFNTGIEVFQYRILRVIYLIFYLANFLIYIY